MKTANLHGVRRVAGAGLLLVAGAILSLSLIGCRPSAETTSSTNAPAAGAPPGAPLNGPGASNAPNGPGAPAQPGRSMANPPGPKGAGK
jgi:hypothetical protein